MKGSPLSNIKGVKWLISQMSSILGVKMLKTIEIAWTDVSNRGCSVPSNLESNRYSLCNFKNQRPRPYHRDYSLDIIVVVIPFRKYFTRCNWVIFDTVAVDYLCLNSWSGGVENNARKRNLVQGPPLLNLDPFKTVWILMELRKRKWPSVCCP